MREVKYDHFHGLYISKSELGSFLATLKYFVSIFHRPLPRDEELLGLETEIKEKNSQGLEKLWVRIK